MSQLPYQAEYAKSGRSACKGCKQLISDKSIRLAIMVQSPFFDGMQPNWYHMRCFFTRTRPKSVDEIAHFQNLRWADQEEIKSQIENRFGTASAPGPTKQKGKRKPSKRKAGMCTCIPDIADYIVEYAKSSRSKCKVCELTIPKGDVRISKKDYEGEVAKKYGPCERWHHVDCFLKARNELGFIIDGSALPGFKALEPDDQTNLITKIPALVTLPIVSPPKKVKKSYEDEKLMETMKRQNEELYRVRDELQSIPKQDLIALLEHNKQDIPEGADRILDRLSDIMTFGALNRCNKCSQGQYVFRSGTGYQCLGYITDWTKCENIVAQPPRVPFKVKKQLKTAYPFLASYQPKVQVRAFKEAAPPSGSQQVAVAALPLYGLEFFVYKPQKNSEEVGKLLSNLGGNVQKNFDPCVVAVISDPSETTKMRLLKPVKQAKEANVPVVSADFLTALSTFSTREDVIKVLRDKTCSAWGSDNIESKIPLNTADGPFKSVYPSKSSSKSIFKSELGMQKLTVKGGATVDPGSKLAGKAHVHKNKNDIYSAVLSLTDLQAQKNSYYKLQVLVSDKTARNYLFRSWGRIGTNIGGVKTEEYATLEEACSVFEIIFEEKSGNQWNARHNFVKVPGKMMMLDVDHGSSHTQEIKVDVNSKLELAVQELMTMIFDIKAMEATMLEFELDLNKMPLGKLSKNQISSAFSLLAELQKLRKDGADRTIIVDRTNRFYTLVPHDFGIENPPILDRDDLINQKIDMLNSLMDIEIAYNLLENTSEDGSTSPIDTHYKKLKANISVLSKKSEEYANILSYVKNTHADTHRNYELVVKEVFKVEREGEEKRYKRFKKLSNRMLLWHGSRLTNFAGILSQGLRIAPPEAPVTGYMFGKGIYFADMVSKSANYCMTTSDNSTGLMLLCEVALGKMHELKQAQHLSKPPSGFHSVKGVGMTTPDPKTVGNTPNGAVIPFGKGKNVSVPGASLLYNEYIVYDVNQVNIQYLVKMHFKYRK